MTDAKPSCTPDTQRIIDALRRIVQALRGAAVQAEKRAGVTSAQIFVLKAVQAAPGCSVAQVAQAVHASQGAVSEVLARLEEKGLLHRQPAVRDRRRCELTLSPQGARALAQDIHTPQEDLIAAIQAMPEDAREALARGLESLVASANLHDESPQMFFERPRT